MLGLTQKAADFASAIAFSALPERCAEAARIGITDCVGVVLTNGKVIEHEPVVYAKGSWQRPLTREELEEKFLDCATRRLDRGHAENLFAQLWSISQLASVRELALTQQRELAKT